MAGLLESCSSLKERLGGVLEVKTMNATLRKKNAAQTWLYGFVGPLWPAATGASRACTGASRAFVALWKFHAQERHTVKTCSKLCKPIWNLSFWPCELQRNVLVVLGGFQKWLCHGFYPFEKYKGRQSLYFWLGEGFSKSLKKIFVFKSKIGNSSFTAFNTYTAILYLDMHQSGKDQLLMSEAPLSFLRNWNFNCC